ncbi:DHHA1 domain-containing protein [Exiguobacterium sp. RIT341]|uniref:alanyl-tRNA editing protein n=1 Tax=Exiguobacterium sp. RIT341 TaxID=1470592 RepID=UPI00044ACBB5|nr:DHHA1 domain-containing protein [Exiguobacterium sp. RIT341]EZP58519.1 Threonyl-tRNA synthetase [Exiguobacterium sp. RIT341]
MRPEQIESDVRTFQTSLRATKQVDGYWVALEKSYFYPESGGQPADRGTLNNQPVLDVQIEDGVVWHQLATPLTEDVAGIIDDAVRIDHAAQHTAQHVISAILHDESNIKTLSFRTGSEVSTLDIETPEWTTLQQEQLDRRLRHVIEQGLPITATEYDEVEALRLPLRKTPQVEGRIRVVQIGTLDYSACGGTHLDSTAQLELILFTGVERIRGNIRLSYVAKERAYQLIQSERRVLREAAQALSVKPVQMLEAVQALQEEQKRLTKQVEHAQEQLATFTLTQALEQQEGILVFEHLNEEIKTSEQLAKAIQEAGRVGVVWNATTNKLLMSSPGEPHLGKFAKAHVQAFNGRGGGSAVQAQAQFTNRDDAMAYVDRLREEYHS